MADTVRRIGLGRATWRIGLGLLLSGLCLGASRAAAAPPAPEAPFNVLWFTGESLRPDHLGCYGYARNTSPRLDAFARRGVLFQNCINASGWTSESMISNFLSAWSPAHGVVTRGHSVPESWRTPFHALAEKGYAIPRLHEFQKDGNYANLSWTMLNPEGLDPIGWLEKHHDRRFFLWYHFEFSHLPYNPPETFRRRFWRDDLVPDAESRERVAVVEREAVVPRGSVAFQPAADRPAIVALYDGEVAYLDWYFGVVLDTLERLGLAERTLVVFSADHGEELLERGEVGHASTLRGGHLYDEILRVPLILALPGRLPEGVRVEAQVRSVDVMPTIFELLGEAPPPGFQGRSLLPLLAGSESEERVAYAACSYQGYLEPDPERVSGRLYALRTSEWKLHREVFATTQATRLYHLRDDPDETTDLAREQPEKLRELLLLLSRWLDDCQRARRAATMR